MKRIKLVIVATALLLTACKTTQDVPDVVTNRPAPVATPVITPMDLQNVQWVVRDIAGLRALADRMAASGQSNVVFYVLDQDSYNALAMNLSEVRRYVNDQNAANDFLSAAIKTNQATLPEPPKPEEPKTEPRRGLFGIF